MKNFIKKLSVVAIIVAMVFAFIPTTIFAADDDITITVNGAVKERTLSAYKLFTIEDVDGGNYYYSWSEEVKTFFKNEYGYETILDAIDALKDFEPDELNELATKFHNYTGISAEDTQTAGANATSLNLTVNGAGYYIVYDETTSKTASVAMLNNVVEDTEIDIKIDEIAVPEKEPDVQSANIGDTVTFTVKSEVPTMAGYTTYTFDIVDTLSKGLTFDSDSVTVKIGDTTLTKSDAETKTDVTYTVTPVANSNGTTTVTIALVDLINIKTTGNNVGEVGDEIVVTYSAKLNSDALTTSGHTYNDVKITYSNDPYTTTTNTTDSDVVHVYTYTVNFTKKNTAGDTLEGAKFVLKSGNKFVKYATVDGKTEISLVDTQAEATVVTSDANGAFSFAGLKAGTYTLVETEAPADYQIPNFDGFTFTIADEFNNDGTLKTVTFTYDNTEEIAKGFVTATATSNLGETSVSVEVLNAKEGVLPTTGGIGTKIFTAVGIVVMLVAGVALIYRNKRNND